KCPRRRHLARGLEDTLRQGGIHPNPLSLRNPVGNGAPQRCDEGRECGSARQCGAEEEAMSLTELLRHVGIFGGAVMVCLALLSVFSVGMIIDKHRRFGLASRQSEKFKPEFKKFLHGGDVQELIEAGKLHENSHVAQVVSAGIIEYDGVCQSGRDPVASLELVTSAIRDSKIGRASCRERVEAREGGVGSE